ncbi:hypothetical protein DdX_18572 [Ditylenchus destructor]|uniref:Uncharacterized protein n=1 Tax=Ditylenchus destructor TaxID=166010 RepID=A0AAD4QY52_9BILA|nr:hypothetical protein DdX_18572 [Ditylenchus destructor]
MNIDYHLKRAENGKATREEEYWPQEKDRGKSGFPRTIPPLSAHSPNFVPHFHCRYSAIPLPGVHSRTNQGYNSSTRAYSHQA